jgi:signal transduction histidine kinase
MRAGSLKDEEARQGILDARRRVSMIRRISTKLVLAVLTVVVLPFVAFSFYIDTQMGERLTRHVVQQALMGLAKDLANQLDDFVLQRHQDVVQWAGLPLTRNALEEYLGERGAARVADEEPLAVWDAEALSRWVREESTHETFDHERQFQRAQLTRELDRYHDLKEVYDLILLVAADGRLVTSTTRQPSDTLLPEEYLARLFDTDFAEEEWFRLVLEEGTTVTIDHHASPFRLPELEDPPDPAWGYNLGFAAPVFDTTVPGRVSGVLFALANWSFLQEIASTPVVRDAFRGLVDERQEPSPYAWIWADDADTILGHPNRGLYYQSVSDDVKLPQLTAAVLDSAEGWGLYPEYTFNDEAKNAAFKRCAPPERGGFGWVLGVGIDNDDIFATANDLRTLLLGGTAVVLLMAVGWTLLIARRTTDPILELQRYTRRVAEGDLEARVETRSTDELGALASDFNRMTRKLKEQQAELVRAEKDAAWREMARQIAHDIRNPLTPIRLSLDLLERARREGSEGSEEILERTMDLIRRQVQNLHEIAEDFYEFTGGHKLDPEDLALQGLIEEVLHLHDAWAVELGVDVHTEGPDAIVRADRGKLRRVFVNLVSNALQAMPDGGELFVDTALENGRVRVSFRDTGHGLAEEARAHLFEPYFTTRSEGTGLGLAISKQVIEQMGGSIELVPAEPEGDTGGANGAPSGGTVATVRLPPAGERA